MELAIQIVLGVVFSVIGYLLHRRDAAQEKQIDELFKQCRENENNMHRLALTLAGEHYKKPELDNMFSMMRSTLKEGFDKIDRAIHELRNGNGRSGNADHD